MQGITQKLACYFGNLGRVPSIRFLGPRDLLHQKHPKAETHHNNSHKAKAPPSPLTSGPSVKFSDLSTKLQTWQMDAINSGGVIDTRYLKVKPIALKKK